LPVLYKTRLVISLADTRDQLWHAFSAQSRQIPIYQLLFQDNLGKLGPERLNKSGF